MRFWRHHCLLCPLIILLWLFQVALLFFSFSFYLCWLASEKAVNLMGDSALITEMGHIYLLEFVKEAITLSEASDFPVSKAGILLQSVYFRLKDAAEIGNHIAERALCKFIEVHKKMVVSSMHFSFPAVRARKNLC